MDNRYSHINTNLEKQEQIYNNLNKAAEKKAFLESEQSKEVEASNEAMKGFMEDMTSQKARQLVIQETIGLLSAITTSLTSISGIIKTIDDGSLSVQEAA